MARPRKNANPRSYPDIITSAETGRPMRRGVKMLTIEVDGFRYTYPQPGWWANLDDPSDEDGQAVDEDNEIASLAVREAKALARGAELTPLQIKAIRERCDLTQREASHVFGGGEKAFEKYESGEVSPSSSMVRLLRLAEKRPNLFKKPARGDMREPSSKSLASAREAIRQASLDRIMERVRKFSQTSERGQVKRAG